MSAIKPPVKDATIEELCRRLAMIEASHDGPTARLIPLWEWELIMKALMAARRRFVSASHEGDSITCRAAVGEALWWVASADEFLRRRLSYELSMKQYYDSLSLRREGRLLGALTFVRNRAGHQIAQVLSVESVAHVPVNVQERDGSIRVVTFRGSVSKLADPLSGESESGLVFAARSSLPPADDKYGERFGRDVWYHELVALRPVDQVLEEIIGSLAATIRIERSGNDVRAFFDVDWPSK